MAAGSYLLFGVVDRAVSGVLMAFVCVQSFVV